MKTIFKIILGINIVLTCANVFGASIGVDAMMNMRADLLVKVMSEETNKREELESFIEVLKDLSAVDRYNILNFRVISDVSGTAILPQIVDGRITEDAIWILLLLLCSIISINTFSIKKKTGKFSLFC